MLISHCGSGSNELSPSIAQCLLTETSLSRMRLREYARSERSPLPKIKCHHGAPQKIDRDRDRTCNLLIDLQFVVRRSTIEPHGH